LTVPRGGRQRIVNHNDGSVWGRISRCVKLNAKARLFVTTLSPSSSLPALEAHRDRPVPSTFPESSRRVRFAARSRRPRVASPSWLGGARIFFSTSCLRRGDGVDAGNPSRASRASLGGY
jgi:hypothetical protein